MVTAVTSGPITCGPACSLGQAPMLLVPPFSSLYHGDCVHSCLAVLSKGGEALGESQAGQGCVPVAGLVCGLVSSMDWREEALP